ncbi:MAG: hypothetical protein IJS41_01425 [Clostridia bacterium]|nr:hypothetical protein [Clostridia bacterium]
MNGINIVQGTTPTITFTVTGYDLTDKTVEIYLVWRGGKLTLDNDRLGIDYDDGATTIAFQLTQAETLKMPVGAAKAQMRFIGADGQTCATVDDAAVLNILNLYDNTEIEYRGENNA